MIRPGVESPQQGASGHIPSPTAKEQGWRFCQSTDEWMQIHDPGVGLLVWDRDCPSLLREGLNDVLWDELPSTRLVVDKDEAQHTLAACFETITLAPSVRTCWIEEMAALVKRFCEVTGTSSVIVRLEKIENNNCRRFHIDNITVRLLCTYLGPSTEWLPSGGIRLSSKEGDDFREEDIQRFPPLSVGLLKGRKHPNSQSEVYHRSPPIADTGQRRFVFCLDVHTPA